MLKHAALLLGLGLAISLTACEKATPSAPAPAPAKISSSDTPKAKPNRNKEGRERGQAPRAGEGEGRRQNRTPPEAAYAACASIAVGDSCSFETPRGTLSGICRQREGADRAVCAGERPEGTRRPRPAE